MIDFKKKTEELKIFRNARDYIQTNYIESRDYDILDMKKYIESLDNITKNELINHYVEFLGRIHNK